jgi:hypothetical protein
VLLTAAEEKLAETGAASEIGVKEPIAKQVS